MARVFLVGAGVVSLRSLALAGLLASSLAAQAPTQSPPSSPQKRDECSIVGMVVKLAGSEPLSKASVHLESMEDRTRSISVVSNAGGRFELKGIDPGRYRLTVSRVGFVTQEYRQKRSDDPGAVLALRPGQELKDLLFRLVPSSVIAGRILDEDGEPLPSVNVTAAREVYSEGKRALSMGAAVETNDLGEYRLFGLPPGRYFVSAVYPRWSRFAGAEDSGSSEPEQQGYAKMYYPGTVDVGKAISIALRGGEEIPSTEILLRKVLTHRIRGRVYNQITGKPGTGTNVMLMPKTNRREWDSLQHANVEKQDGSFDIPEVLPGSYVLTAFWFDEGKIYSTRMPVEVGNADVEGLALTIAPGMNINGQIIWDGKPVLEKDELTVRPVPVGSNLGFQQGTRVSSDSSFTLKDVGEGTYRAEVAGQAQDCYFKDVKYGTSSSLDEGFTVVRGAPATLEITISSHGARVQGTVSDADGLPAAGVWVVLVPDVAHSSEYRLYKTQTTDQYGRFDLRGIPPGEYKLFSWEQVESGAWERSGVPEAIRGERRGYCLPGRRSENAQPRGHPYKESGRGEAVRKMILQASRRTNELAGGSLPGIFKNMIARVWHGVAPEAKTSEHLKNIRKELFQAHREAAGNQGAILLSRRRADSTEFLLLSLWESQSFLESLTGPDIDGVMARELINPIPMVKNYEVVVAHLPNPH